MLIQKVIECCELLFCADAEHVECTYPVIIPVAEQWPQHVRTGGSCMSTEPQMASIYTCYYIEYTLLMHWPDK